MRKIFSRMVCLIRGHKYTTDHPGRGFASLDGYYTKAVCTRCGHKL